MRDRLGPGTRLGYCTNVHAGATLAAVKANLAQHACAVRERVCPGEPLGIGLWLPEDAAREIADDAAPFAEWLGAHGLDVFTFNGFPQGDFHDGVVKHAVYAPTWADEARLDYTLRLARILGAIVRAGEAASISTLPLGWRPAMTGHDVELAAHHLRTCAAALARLEAETGRLIHVDLEPEPGCVLDRSDDVVRFFRDHLLPGGDEATIRRHVRVCHDVCHAAVMVESQDAALHAYAAAGIAVGKVQLSCALVAPFDGLAPEERAAAWRELGAFHEPRYLHQTTVVDRDGTTGAARERHFEDLPAAMAGGAATGTWRVHFHVPVFLAEIGRLRTTQPELIECLAAVRGADVRQFEVETYAWDVLPAHLRIEPLAEGIARELSWVLERAREGTP